MAGCWRVYTEVFVVGAVAIMCMVVVMVMWRVRGAREVVVA